MPQTRPQSALVAEQKQQHKRIISTVLKLNALTKLNNLKGYAEAADWQDSLSNSAKALSTGVVIAQGSPDCYTHLLEAYLTAISNGLKQLHLNWPANLSVTAGSSQNSVFLSAVRTVYMLCRNLGVSKRGVWYSMKYAQQGPNIAVTSGFSQHVILIMSRVLLILRPLQQTAEVSQQQFTDTDDELVRLGILLLDLWLHLFEHWQGPKLTDDSLTPSINPAVGLALALMNTASAQVADGNQHSCSSRRSSQITPTDNSSSCTTMSKRMRVSLEQSLGIAEQLIAAIYETSSNSATAAAAKVVLIAADVQKMLLLGLAATAIRQLDPAGASAIAAHAQVASQEEVQQQQHHGHLRLLTTLGFDTASIVPDLGEIALTAFSNLRIHLLFVKGVEYLYDIDNQEYTQLHARIAADSSFQGSKLGLHWLLQMATPVLHTLKDLFMLHPTDDDAGLAQYLRSFSIILLFELELGDLQHKQQVWQWLLQPMFEKVCAAAQKISSEASQQGQSSTRAQPPVAELETRVMQSWALATKLAFGSDIPPGSTIAAELRSIIKQQPVTTLMAAETLARSTLAGAKQRNATKVLWFIAAVFEALGLQHGDKPSELGDMLRQPDMQRQLSSLICSHLKLMMVISAAPATAHVTDAQRLAFSGLVHLIMLMNRLLEAHLLELMRQATTSQTVADWRKQHQQSLYERPLGNWAVPFGRAIHASAVSLQLQLAFSPGDTGLFRAAVSMWPANMAAAAAMLDVISDQDAELIRVKQQIETMGQLLASATDSAMADSTHVAVAQQQQQQQELLTQMQQCGSAICAALPMKFCCNNPACVNLAKLSEQQLVAGKGSRCSGCKVARYCSRDCQLKHWKQHKKTCKRIQQAQAAANGLQ